MLPSFEAKMFNSSEDSNFLVSFNQTSEYNKMQLFKSETSIKIDSQVNSKMIERYLSFSTFVSPVDTSSLVGNETYLFTRQVKVKFGKSTLVIICILRKRQF